MLDYYNLSAMLSTDELQIQSSARNYLESEISPHVSKWWEDGEFPEEKIPEFGEMGTDRSRNCTRAWDFRDCGSTCWV